MEPMRLEDVVLASSRKFKMDLPAKEQARSVGIAHPSFEQPTQRETDMGMGKGALLWLVGIPLPIIILLMLFWR